MSASNGSRLTRISSPSQHLFGGQVVGLICGIAEQVLEEAADAPAEVDSPGARQQRTLPDHDGRHIEDAPRGARRRRSDRPPSCPAVRRRRHERATDGYRSRPLPFQPRCSPAALPGAEGSFPHHHRLPQRGREHGPDISVAPRNSGSSSGRSTVPTIDLMADGSVRPPLPRLSHQPVQQFADAAPGRPCRLAPQPEEVILRERDRYSLPHIYTIHEYVSTVHDQARAGVGALPFRSRNADNSEE